MRSLIVVLVIAFATPAVAQPATDEKSPSLAVGLSIGITTGGIVTLLAGDHQTSMLIGLGAMYIGPSTGQWYAGEVGGLGLAARAVGGVALVYGLSQMLQSECDAEAGEDCSGAANRGRLGALLFYSGAGLWIGSSIADVVFAKRAADRWNQRHALTVAPTSFNSGAGRANGLVLTARF